MTIRAAAPADAEAIARVHVQAWHESYRGLLPDPPHRGKDHRAAHRAVARRGGGSGAHPARDRGRRRSRRFGSAGRARSAALGAQGEVAAIYLLDRVKRRGLGRALFDTLRDALEAAGFADAGLWVLTENTPARRFYEAIGGRAGATRSEHEAGHVLDEVAYLWS
jgi:ribosomal protein S18 acetylase RimI-like enzyme